MIDNYGGSDVWNPRGETSPLRSYWGSDIANRDINYSVPGPGSQNPRADIAANFRWSADPNRDYVPYNDNQMRSPLLEQAYGDQDAAGANREKLYPNFYGKAALDRVLGRTPPQPFVTPSYPGSNPWSMSSAMSDDDLKAGSLPKGGNQPAIDAYWQRVRGEAVPITVTDQNSGKVLQQERGSFPAPNQDYWQQEQARQLAVQRDMGYRAQAQGAVPSPGAVERMAQPTKEIPSPSALDYQQNQPWNPMLQLMTNNPQLFRALMMAMFPQAAGMGDYMKNFGLLRDKLGE